MKLKYILPIIALFFATGSFAQDPSAKARKTTVSTERELPTAIIINDSIYKLPNVQSYGFDVLENNTVKSISRKDITNINKIIKVRNNIMSFRINYDCGCGKIKYDLVSDGKIQKTEDGKEYYNVRLYFNSNTTCLSLCHKDVNFDISQLLKNGKPAALKFEGFADLIEIK